MIPKVSIANLPTPVQSLPRLSTQLGGPKILIKRDDLTGLAFGGNKTRKLEYLMGEALELGSDVVLSAGALQSNHCRQVAAAAAKFGLGCILVLVGNPPNQADGNLLLDKMLGAKIVYTAQNQRDTQLKSCFEDALVKGLKPYLIPYGGSNATGALAYADAIAEFIQQDVPADWIVFPSSSGGTQAGLIIGASRSKLNMNILGISVDSPKPVLQSTVQKIIAVAVQKYNIALPEQLCEIQINDNYLGAGYGVMGQREVEAIELFARLEGVLLDPVYTGRAAAGMIDLIRNGFFKSHETLLFWHTGGTPALFAQRYASILV